MSIQPQLTLTDYAGNKSHLSRGSHLTSVEEERRLGPYSVQSIGAAEADSLAIGHNPGRVTTPTQYTSMLALILPTSEG